MSNEIFIRQLRTTEPIPYSLLLLADEEMQAIERYIHASAIYIAEMEDKAIGVYALYPLNERQAEIKAIAVDDDYQNRGIGKQLLQHAATVARKAGFKELLIGTPTIALKQLSIYQKAGFTWFDTKKDFFVTSYTQLIYEDGVQLRDMAMLKKIL